LLASERSEKAVNSSVAGFLACGGEFADQHLQLLARQIQLLFVVDDELRAGGAVLPERLLAEEVLLEHPADRLADEGLLRRLPAGRDFERAGGVFEHLRGRHLSPLSLKARLDRVDATQELVAGRCVENRLHGHSIVMTILPS